MPRYPLRYRHHLNPNPRPTTLVGFRYSRFRYNLLNRFRYALALQWLEMLEGRPLCEHLNFRRMDEAERRSIRPVVLKRLIREGLIEVMGLSPAPTAAERWARCGS